MRSNLYQIRAVLLYATLFWLALLAAVAPSLFTAAFVVLAIGIAVTLFMLIPASGEDSAFFAHTLAIVCLGVAATTALVIVARAGPLALWLAPVTIAASWAATAAAAFWHYNRLITIPTGIMHVYTSLLGSRVVRGYAKIVRPNPQFVRLQATVPTRRFKVDVDVFEIGTRPGASPGRVPRRSEDRGPPPLERRPGIWNIYRIQVAIELALSPGSWRSVLSIPSEDLIVEQRATHGGQGRNPWHEPRFWSGIAKSYIQELADELTRQIIHETGWSALTVWQRKGQLANLISEQLALQTEGYGIIIHTLDVIDIAIDEPNALRRTRDMELMSETWQHQQAMLLETFQLSLGRLGLQLNAEEIGQLTRVHLWDLVSHMKRFGHLDHIVAELVAGPTDVQHRSPPGESRPPFRKAA